MNFGQILTNLEPFIGRVPERSITIEHGYKNTLNIQSAS